MKGYTLRSCGRISGDISLDQRALWEAFQRVWNDCCAVKVEEAQLSNMTLRIRSSILQLGMVRQASLICANYGIYTQQVEYCKKQTGYQDCKQMKRLS